MQTFRRLRLAEIKAIKPLRIRVVTVKPGDTAERLARRMATDHPLQQFRVLNGLGPSEQPKAGDLVKLVPNSAGTAGRLGGFFRKAEAA